MKVVLLSVAALWSVGAMAYPWDTYHSDENARAEAAWERMNETPDQQTALMMVPIQGAAAHYGVTAQIVSQECEAPEQNEAPWWTGINKPYYTVRCNVRAIIGKYDCNVGYKASPAQCTDGVGLYSIDECKDYAIVPQDKESPVLCGLKKVRRHVRRQR